MSHFHKKITYDNDQNYKIVSDDLYKNGIFDDNDNEIANNIYRKVTIPNENKAEKKRIERKIMIQDYKMEVIENGTRKSKIFNRYDK